MEPRRFVKWVVYGTVNGKMGVVVQVFDYRDRDDAEACAKSVPDGYVNREKHEQK